MMSSPALRARLPLHRLLLLLAVLCTALTASAAPLKVLFLGDNGHHQPGTRLRDLAPAMIARGIHLVYTEDVAAALTLENLKRYDALLIYANLTRLAPEHEKAMLDYVTQGGGLVPLHCASACFGNSDAYIALVGGRFQRHGTGTFTVRNAAPQHPVMQGFTGFESWDETYQHDRHNETGRTVLEFRENEPWTWVRSEGRGRVFYTAWGHDARTWTNPGFHDLVERGIRFAAGQALPASLAKGPAVTPFEYEEGAKVPYYSPEPGSARGGANPWPRIQKPLPAAQSMEHVIVPAGFEVQLFAADPDIKKPVAMAWDERGRLWIIETTDYPNRVLPPGEPGNDRIVICEDTNRDGKADKYTVFADGLNIPTSLAFSNGGVLVTQMPHTLFLKDTNGDDKADLRDVFMSGFGRRDTHAGPSNLVYGMDNWIWGVVGYSGFGGTVGGKSFNFAQAYFRFKPDGSAMEHIRNNNNNSWGIGFNEAGVVFGSTANNNPSVYVPIPQRHYAPAGLTAANLGSIADTSRYLPVTAKVREVDVFWGYTAAAGHAIYTARSFPKEYWDRIAFVTEPTGHLVGQFNLMPNGADFKSHNPTNLFASDDEYTAPIMAEVGPDGAVWIIDWYNYIIQHNPTPEGFPNGAGNAYENELRDKRHGRIYRVVWKEGKPSTQPNFRDGFPTQLVHALKNDNLLWRRHAQRLLVERGRKDVVPALIELTRDQSMDEIGFNAGATHALWALHGLNAIDADPAALEAATAALKHPSAAVRRNAAMVLPRTVASVTAILNGGLLTDKDGQVRLAAMLALAESPDVPAAGAGLRSMLAAQMGALDRWSADAAKMAATNQAKGFLAAATPEDRAAAQAARNQGTRPILSSATLMSGGTQGWTVEKTNGEVTATRADIARAGHHSLQLALSGAGASGGATTKVPVKRNYRYEINGYIKTDGFPAAPAGGRGGRGGPPGGRGGPLGAGGATISVTQGVSSARGSGGQGTVVRGTSDWTPVRVPLVSGNVDEITLAASASLGNAANNVAAGSAWFDDVSIRELGPADESVTNPLPIVLNHVIAQVETTAQPAGTGTSGITGATVVAPASNAVVLTLGTIRDMMKYDKAELTVKAGQQVRLVFTNTDTMQHNVLILAPGTLEATGALADRMLNDPSAAARMYVPETPNVIANTPLVDSGQRTELMFTAPTTPGRYPYVCTFPGHWRMMQGVLIVTP